MKELSYKDDNDKCYGAAGMAIGIVVLRGHGKLAGLSVDSAPGSIMEFTDDFYFSGNQGMMATTAWQQMVENFNVMAGMLVSNILCRNIVGQHCVPSDSVRSHIREAVVAEGVDSCSLEPEEAGHLFDNNYQKFMNLYSRRGIHSVVHEFASVLQSRRHLTRIEVLEELRALDMI